MARSLSIVALFISLMCCFSCCFYATSSSLLYFFRPLKKQAETNGGDSTRFCNSSLATKIISNVAIDSMSIADFISFYFGYAAASLVHEFLSNAHLMNLSKLIRTTHLDLSCACLLFYIRTLCFLLYLRFRHCSNGFPKP